MHYPFMVLVSLLTLTASCPGAAQAEELAGQCRQFIVENFSSVAMTDGFGKLDKELMTELVRAAAAHM